ncbi:MAG TPA: DUF456 domain-containing protein [Nitrospirae bacterium]|nr:DUF456 domain-containing protein [Nitrospirota bacterium]
MILDTVLIFIGGACLAAGIIGCVLPVLPGPVLSYAGLLILQFSSIHPFTATFLIIYAILVALAAALDYVIPIYGTKKFEGSKYGMWGSAVGLVLGMIFFFPFGIILGPVLGAFTGELINGKTKDKALKSALGSFLGFLAGTAMKLILSLSMVYYFVASIYNFYAGP